MGRGELWEDGIQNRNIKYRNSFWSAEYLSHLKGLSVSQKPNFLEEGCVCVSGSGGGVLLLEFSSSGKGYSTELSSGVRRAGLGLQHGCAASGGVGPEELPNIRRFSGSVLMALAPCHAQKPFCPGERME